MRYLIYSDITGESTEVVISEEERRATSLMLQVENACPYTPCHTSGCIYRVTEDKLPNFVHPGDGCVQLLSCEIAVLEKWRRRVRDAT